MSHIIPGALHKTISFNFNRSNMAYALSSWNKENETVRLRISAQVHSVSSVFLSTYYVLGTLHVLTHLNIIATLLDVLLPLLHRWENGGIVKVNNLPNITQLISGRAGIKTNTIVQIQISTLFHGVTLPLMVIAGVGSVTDQGSYLQCSENPSQLVWRWPLP